MSKPDAPKLVTALFSFKGKNNDELCFKKGDIITITQTDDEGWWEGTLHDKTGWFPSNYVKEYRGPSDGGGLSPVKTSLEKVPQESPIHQKLNRDIVLKDMVDSERVSVAELQGLVNNFLHPLEATNILKKDEYKQLLGNVHEVLETHQRLLNSLEAATSGSSSKVGNLFLSLAPRIKSTHTAYCNNHPRAVCILDRYRDELNEFMERSGAISPGILVLTTGLSKPFRRVEKYSSMLQELERYTEKNHPDRGDTQRSIAVYREIADRCACIRKQRELALQVLTSGIKGWEGEELNSLGEIIHVGSVTLITAATGLDRRDRYFVLFPTTLLVLSTSARMSSFVYEGKLPLTGISVTQIEDTDEIRNAFEITGPMIENIIVLCATKDDRQRWIELLIQEQTSGVLKSPTIPRVSYITQPPYARLSRYFAKLVRRKIIRPELMKKLLYLQYVLRPDLSNVKMRRANVTTYAVCPMRATDDLFDDSESSSENEIREPLLPRIIRKSTLTLDVKYAVGDIDLSTVGKGSFAESSDYARFESSRSLPITGIGIGIGKDIEVSNDENASTFPLSFPSSREFRRDFVTEVSGIGNWRNQFPTELHHSASIDVAEPRNRRYNCPTAASIHSTDSGMAESYRLNSSDINSSCKSYTRISNKCGTQYMAGASLSESENDENKYEYQCICTSPFGSTPTDSARLSNVYVTRETSTEDLRSDDLSGNGTRNHPVEKRVLVVATGNHDDDDGDKNDYKNDDKDNDKDDDKDVSAKHKRFTQPIPCTNRIVRKVRRNAQQPHCPAFEKDHEKTNQVYTSGLYAHWWLKKPIPCFGNIEQAMLCETNSQSNGKQPQPQQQQLQQPQQRAAVEHCSSPGIKIPWSVATLRPAPPLYTLKTFGKADASLDLSRAPRVCNERQFEEDAIILKVIEGYCLSVNARFTVHSGESNPVLDYDSTKARDRVSLTHNRGNWDFCSNRTLSETVKTLKNQMTDLQSQMSLLTKQLDEERRSRLSLAATVKRSMGVVDGSIS